MTDGSRRSSFVARVVTAAGTGDRRGALAAATRALAGSTGVTLDERSLRLFDRDPGSDRFGILNGGVDPPPSPPAPELLGLCFEALLSDGARRAGAHHTPKAVADRVVALALDGGPALSVCDPAVGGGVFLLAAAEHLHRGGVDRTEVLDRLWGFDVDPLAVAVTEAALALWSGIDTPRLSDRLVVGDFLDRAVEERRPTRGWSAIVGNPPFQSQLAGRTARDRRQAGALRERFGPPAGGYVDTAGLFMLAGTEHLADGGRLAMIVPASLMAADDAAPLRQATTEAAPVQAVWLPGQQPFGAAVDVVVPILERGGPREPVALVADGAGGGPATIAVPDPGPDWSLLLADAEGVPRVVLGGASGTIADRADVTAGFRQHFYGLAGAVAEAAGVDGRPLLTVGLVDPLTSHWGRRPTRLAGVDFEAPVLDPSAIEDAEVADWVAARHRPKVLVATQTRVVEAAVDPAGTAVPSTPLISVEPHDPGADLWLLAAVLCAPPVTAWFHRRAAGGGLARGRIRPSAKRVRQVPLPTDVAGWAAGATLAEQASAESDPHDRRRLLSELGAVMTAAYGADGAVTSWWEGLLPTA